MLKTQHHVSQKEVGLDEAGRGSLIGPVVAAAVVWNPAITAETHPEVKEIRDSKKLSAKKRQRLRTFIEQQGALHQAVAWVDADRIDEINILKATFQAMHHALDSIAFNRAFSGGAHTSGKSKADSNAEMYERSSLLDTNTQQPRFDAILVDGSHFRPYVYPCGSVEGAYVPHTCIVDGDNTYLSIAAASILAKVKHDELIESLVKAHPELAEQYDLLHNMGYGTRKHLEGLQRYGPSPYHRRSFKCCMDSSLNSVTT